MSQTFRKSHIALAVGGAIVAISTLSYLATKTTSVFLLGSVGASALLIFVLPEAPLSQPRSVVLGHLSFLLFILLAFRVVRFISRCRKFFRARRLNCGLIG